MGLAGIVSSSVANAASSSARWYALFIGVPLLVYATRSLLRTLIVTHRLVWTDMRGAVPKPTLPSTLRLLLVLLAYFVVTGLANLARGWSPTGGLLVTLSSVLYAALWLLVSEGLRTAMPPGATSFPAPSSSASGSRCSRSSAPISSRRRQKAGRAPTARSASPPRSCSDSS